MQGPIGIEVPDAEEAGGVVAPEDLIDAGDGFSGQHLPLAADAAGGADPPGGRDPLPRASAELHEGQAIAAPEQLGVALIFDGGVISSRRRNQAIIGERISECHYSF